MRSIAVIAFLGGLIGCASTQSRMIDSADQLELQALTFADTTRYQPGYEFAVQARHFHDAVAQGTGDQSIVMEFRELWRSYHALRDQVDSTSGVPIRAGLKPVTRAFVDVERHMGGYASADHGVYARGGYVLDPYYND